MFDTTDTQRENVGQTSGNVNDPHIMPQNNKKYFTLKRVTLDNRLYLLTLVNA